MYARENAPRKPESMKNAKVSRLEVRAHYGAFWPEEYKRNTVTVFYVWKAEHDCGWTEELSEWHNAYWSAYHHVQYDCRRKQQPSSGIMSTVRGAPDPSGLEVEPKIKGGLEKHPYPIYDSVFMNLQEGMNEVDTAFRTAGDRIREMLKEQGYSE